MYKKIEIKKLVNPEEQIKSLLQTLTAHVAWIDTRLEIYQYLQDCIKDKRIDALNVAPAFFRNIQEALLTDIILGLDKLYAEGKNAKRSLIHYLRQVQMHFPTLKPTTEKFSTALIKHQLTEIELVRPLLYNLKIHRDRFYAHHAPKYFDNRFKLNEDAPLSPGDLGRLTELAKDILHTHHGGLLNVERLMRIVNANDVSFVIKSIQRYEKMVKDPEVFEILVKRDDLLND